MFYVQNSTKGALIVFLEKAMSFLDKSDFVKAVFLELKKAWCCEPQNSLN